MGATYYLTSFMVDQQMQKQNANTNREENVVADCQKARRVLLRHAEPRHEDIVQRAGNLDTAVASQLEDGPAGAHLDDDGGSVAPVVRPDRLLQEGPRGHPVLPKPEAEVRVGGERERGGGVGQRGLSHSHRLYEVLDAGALQYLAAGGR